MRISLIIGVSSIAWLASATSAFAQETVAEGVDESQTSSEIVVTAQRRNERLQEVPVAVTALSGEDIAAAGVMQTTDLAKVTPGLLTIQGSGFYTPYIRGVGAKTITPGNESAVATYIDGVYQTDKQGLLLSGFSDVSSIQILRGPQGTLFGRNATGGAVLVTTRGPSDSFTAKTEATVGSDEYGAKLFVAGPIAPTLSFSAAGFYRYETDYIRNLNPANGIGDKLGSVRNYGARAKLRWEPVPDLSIQLAADWTKAKDEGPWAPQAIAGTGLTAAEGTARARGVTIPDIRTQRPVFAGESLPFILSEGHGQSLTVQWDSDDVTVKSITAHRQDKSSGFLDLDGSPLPLFYFRTDLRSDVWQQEITLGSNGSGPFSWLFGGFFMDMRDGYQQLDQNVGIPYPYTPAALAARPAGSAHIDQYSYVDIKSLGIFGELSYELASRTKLTIGLRYTDEKHALDKRNQSVTTIPNGTGGVRTLPANTVVNLCAANPQCNRRLSTPFSEWTYRAVLSQDFSDDIMGYVSFNRGFKSGVYNISTISAPNVIATRPETINAYEVGLKTQLFDRRLTLNASAYYNDYKNMQVAVTIPPNTTQISINAASAKIAGIELEAVLRASENLTLQGGISVFLKSEYGSFPNCSVFRANPNGGNIIVSTDCSGTTLPGTPDSFNLRAEYRVPFASGSSLAFNGLLSHQTAFDYYAYASAETRAPRQSAITTVNLSAKWASANDRFSVGIWSRDLLDQKDVFRGMFANAFGYQTTFARGATYGLTIGFDY